MTDTTAKIRAKGLETTGVTEELANQMFGLVGKHYMGIVEWKVEEPHGPNAEGKRRVDLVLTLVEPATDQVLEDHLRQLTRVLHQNRVLTSDDEQLTIETQDDLAPSVEEAIAAQRAHQAGQPHIFDPADDGQDCVVCGEDFEHDLHVVLTDPEIEPDDDEPADPATQDPADEDQATDVDEHQLQGAPA